MRRLLVCCAAAGLLAAGYARAERLYANIFQGILVVDPATHLVETTVPIPPGAGYSNIDNVATPAAGKTLSC